MTKNQIEIFKINVLETFEITEMKPFGIKFSVDFNHPTFKYRVTNKIRENELDLKIFEQYNSFQIKVRKLLNLGYVDVSIEENCYPGTGLLIAFFAPESRQFFFDSKEKRDDANKKIKKTLIKFLNEEYQEYLNLKKEGSLSI